MSFLRNLIYNLLQPVRALLYSPARLFQAPKRFLGMSLPARVAWALALVLVLATVGAFVAFLLSPDRSRWEVWFEPLHILVLVGLIVAIPLVTYYALRLWLEGDASPYPDIDRAWSEGIRELERHGIDWNRVPLFLVVGASGESQADALMEAGALELVVSGVPEGRAPLRWYANDRAIFLCCTGAGSLAPVNRAAVQSPAAGPSPSSMPQPSITGTLVAGAGVRGTVAPSGASPAAAAVDTSQPAVAYDPLRGTLMPGAGGDRGAAMAAAPATEATALSRVDRQEEIRRLEYVGNLLVRLRQPLCPLNGVLVLLGWNAIQGPYGTRDLPESIRLDLEAVRRATTLCCPVLTLVAGLESEPGFLELARRVGVEQARSSRFGRGFDHWTPPTAENLDALTSHACGAFEDWVYDLFQRPDALSKPGNSKLYTLLCRIRSRVQERLRTVLIQGMGSDVGGAANAARPNLFGGCYFAATGESSDRQSFVRGVLDKLMQLEEELEWTDEAVRSDAFFRRLANVLVVTNGLLVLATVALLVYWLWGS